MNPKNIGFNLPPKSNFFLGCPLKLPTLHLAPRFRGAMHSSFPLAPFEWLSVVFIFYPIFSLVSLVWFRIRCTCGKTVTVSADCAIAHTYLNAICIAMFQNNAVASTLLQWVE